MGRLREHTASKQADKPPGHLHLHDSVRVSDTGDRAYLAKAAPQCTQGQPRSDVKLFTPAALSRLGQSKVPIAGRMAARMPPPDSRQRGTSLNRKSC